MYEIVTEWTTLKIKIVSCAYAQKRIQLIKKKKQGCLLNSIKIENITGDYF